MNKELENKLGHAKREIAALNKKLRILKTECNKLRKDAEAQRFLLEQSREVMNDSKCLYVHLNAYLAGTASVDDILETKAGHEAMQENNHDS